MGTGAVAAEELSDDEEDGHFTVKCSSGLIVVNGANAMAFVILRKRAIGFGTYITNVSAY